MTKITIELTDEQIVQLQPLVDEAKVDSYAGKKGMVLGQVDTTAPDMEFDSVTFGFIPNDKARKIERLGADE